MEYVVDIVGEVEPENTVERDDVWVGWFEDEAVSGTVFVEPRLRVGGVEGVLFNENEGF